MELGKVYLDLGYLTQSLQVHSRALELGKVLGYLRDLDTAKDPDFDTPNLQVNLAKFSMCSEVAILLACQ